MSSPRLEYRPFYPIPSRLTLMDTENLRLHLVYGHNHKQEIAFEDGLLHRGVVSFGNIHHSNPPGVTMAQRFENEFLLSHPHMKMRSIG